MARRVEDRIRKLCSELLATSGEEELGRILVELREALHEHIERLRKRCGAYPFLVERRARHDQAPPSNQAAEKAVEETSSKERAS
jgi:hypothetical protein